MHPSQEQSPNKNVWELDQTYELQVEIVDDFWRGMERGFRTG